MKNLGLTLFFIGAASWGASAWKPGRNTFTMKSGGAERSYILRLPKAIERTGAQLPLVVLLHGFSGSAAGIEAYSGFGALSDSEGFILAVPQGLGSPAGWNCGFINLGKVGVDDAVFLSTLLDKVRFEYPVDPARIYVVGHSNGAMMANVLGATRSDRIAAIAAVSGVIGVGKNNPKYMTSPNGPLSVLDIHGTADQVVAYSSATPAVLAGPSAKEAVKWWADKIGLNEKPIEEKLKGYDSISYEGASATVRLLSLTGWTHEWPSSQRSPINGARVIWDFFKAHPKHFDQ